MQKSINSLALRLERATDADFRWLLGDGEATRPHGVAPDLAPKAVLHIIRTQPSNWLVVSDEEIVGIISLKVDRSEQVEIGYGVSSSRTGRGFASAAVGALLPMLKRRGVPVVIAETTFDNVASQRVLQRNGFAAVGERIDDEDGVLIVWKRLL